MYIFTTCCLSMLIILNKRRSKYNAVLTITVANSGSFMEKLDQKLYLESLQLYTFYISLKPQSPSYVCKLMSVSNRP